MSYMKKWLITLHQYVLNQYYMTRLRLLYKRDNPRSKYALQFKNALIVVPHADDELIGCYCFTKENRKKITLFYCGLLGSNISLKNMQTREQEFRTYCEQHNYKYLISEPNKWENALRKEIESNVYDVVLLPSIVDWHPEHRATNAILMKINLSGLDKILWYHISVPIPLLYINYSLPLRKSDVIEKWRDFNKYYSSQKHLNINRFKIWETVFSKSSYASEDYIVFNVEGYSKAIQTYDKLHINPSILRHLLNNTPKIYKEANRIYRAIL